MKHFIGSPRQEFTPDACWLFYGMSLSEATEMFGTDAAKAVVRRDAAERGSRVFR